MLVTPRVGGSTGKGGSKGPKVLKFGKEKVLGQFPQIATAIINFREGNKKGKLSIVLLGIAESSGRHRRGKPVNSYRG